MGIRVKIGNIPQVITIIRGISLKLAEKVSQEYKSKNLDHLGLVSAMCAELQIAKEIDEIIPSSSLDRKVSTGQLVVAMILNGLGFTSKALYMTPNYFIDKPVDRLIGKNIKAENLNDDALGRALDPIFRTPLM